MRKSLILLLSILLIPPAIIISACFIALLLTCLVFFPLIALGFSMLLSEKIIQSLLKLFPNSFIEKPIVVFLLYTLFIPLLSPIAGIIIIGVAASIIPLLMPLLTLWGAYESAYKIVDKLLPAQEIKPSVSPLTQALYHVLFPCCRFLMFFLNPSPAQRKASEDNFSKPLVGSLKEREEEYPSVISVHSAPGRLFDPPREKLKRTYYAAPTLK